MPANPTPAKRAPVEAQTARRLRDALRRVVIAQGVLEATQRPCGVELSLSHAYALLELFGSKPMSVSDLAARLSLDRTNVSRLCIQMERAGDLRREANSSDRRQRRLVLTAQGRKRALAVEASSAAHFGRLAAALGDWSLQVIDALELLEHVMHAHSGDTE